MTLTNSQPVNELISSHSLEYIILTLSRQVFVLTCKWESTNFISFDLNLHTQANTITSHMGGGDFISKTLKLIFITSPLRSKEQRLVGSESG